MQWTGKHRRVPVGPTFNDKRDPTSMLTSKMRTISETKGQRRHASGTSMISSTCETTTRGRCCSVGSTVCHSHAQHYSFFFRGVCQEQRSRAAPLIVSSAAKEAEPILLLFGLPIVVTVLRVKLMSKENNSDIRSLVGAPLLFKTPSPLPG